MRKVVLLGLIALGYMSLCAMPPAPWVGGREPYKPRVKHSERPTGLLTSSRSTSVRRMPTEATNEEDRGLCILVNFDGKTFCAENRPQDFDSLANGLHYTYDGSRASVREYFREQSNGLYVPHFDVVGPVDLPHDYAWYGTDYGGRGNDRYVVDFVLDACYGAQALGVNFADYDANGDGYIDFVYIIYAGYGQSDSGIGATIWPHEWEMESALAYGMTSPDQDSFYVYVNDQLEILDERLPELDGKTLYLYACSSELQYWDDSRSGIATMCHEFAHVLGLPDYYITHSDSPMEDAGEEPGTWSLMSTGSHTDQGRTPPNFSAYDKYYLGWVTPTFLSSPQQVTLPADGRTYFALSRDRQVPESGPYTEDTLYFLENRQLEGWDTYIPGHGLVLWRVVFDTIMWQDNTPNDYTTRYCVISATTGEPKEGTNKYYGNTQPEVPFPGENQVTTLSYFGQTITNITETNGVISFIYDHYTPSAFCEPVLLEDDGARYNILGQRVTEEYKGIIIIRNGHKQLRL